MRAWPAFLLWLLAAACAPLPPVPGGTVATPSPSFDERRPHYVIIHQTSNDNAADALATLTNPARKVSAHYLIGRDGTLYQLVAEDKRAWHAGLSCWGGNGDVNSASLGIELDNNGEEPFAEAQIARLIELLGDLKSRYRIPAANFLGHGDVAPGRKVDPSVRFPWERLAAAGFGLWCGDRPAAPVPAFDFRLGLRALGYCAGDPGATLVAFRRHFRALEAAGEPDAADAAVLDCLLRRPATPARPDGTGANGG